MQASNSLLNDRAKTDEVVRPVDERSGVGPITALTFTSTIEHTHRFARSDDVGAYAGLVPRRSQSGERDTSGHISKAGDPMLRKALYEAANVALSQVNRPFALQQWGRKMAETKGARRARTAVARKLAALLHSLWLNETEFCWT
ncbi:transposase [Novosphingobium sp. M1R2S20]|uniref:Transposase n=1 Tax=Novosphingobium rhizovicinum TaxID=3228928 RepID=A0ABV3RHG3_9SPHN